MLPAVEAPVNTCSALETTCRVRATPVEEETRQFTVWEFFGHSSFALTAFSFYVRDILVLHALSICAGAVGILYNYNIPAGPLWLVIFWLCLFMMINAARIGHLVYERRKVAFSDEEREFYETVFRHFTPVEFMKLLWLGEWREAGENELLAEQGREIDDLNLIYNGEVAIERDGAAAARSRDGTMIGEMSFIKGSAATATVRVTRPARYLTWPKDALRKMLRRNPTVTMKTVLSMDLMKKLGGAPA